jgi:hypothetical protein
MTVSPMVVRPTLLALALAGATTLAATFPAAAQDEAAVMIAAARWAQERLPSGSLRLDPHRTGEGVGQALAEQVARTVGAQLGTLEETRVCANPMDASTCRLEANALLALAMPSIKGDVATIRVYAWHRTDSSAQPVARETWNLRLTRTGAGWAVAGAASRAN